MNRFITIYYNDKDYRRLLILYCLISNVALFIIDNFLLLRITTIFISFYLSIITVHVYLYITYFNIQLKKTYYDFRVHQSLLRKVGVPALASYPQTEPRVELERLKNPT